MLDLARLNQLAHSARHLFDGNVRVDAVLVEEVDGVDPESLERGLGDLLDVRRSTVQGRRALPARVESLFDVESELGGDDHLRADGGERLAYQLLVRVWA